jgi:hypothetical protein
VRKAIHYPKSASALQSAAERPPKRRKASP